jgi:alanyl-tRNA synthetase
MTFMISDGIMPSNNGRGYVLRRIIRRAVRHGRKLGIKGSFLPTLAERVIETSKDGYPELWEKRDFILSVVKAEEEKFEKTYEQGMEILEEMEAELTRSGKKVLSGEDAFKLYDTYGFPVDNTKEILEEKGFTVDEEGFKTAMEQQKKQGRKDRLESGKMAEYSGHAATVYDELDPSLSCSFDGYDKLEKESKVISMISLGDEEALVEALSDGEEGAIITEETPFYGTMGGQVGDTGLIVLGSEDKDASALGKGAAVFEVKKTEHVGGNKIAHIGVMKSGMIKLNDVVTLKVDAENRMDTCRNHSATHLLQKALREVLGTHVEQAGSFQDAGRTRFDFSHFQAMTKEELQKVEDIVNQKIREGLDVRTEVMSLEEAKKTGAMALFGEKYGSEVRVVRMGDFSTELCGGTHVKNTLEILQFKIVSESGVAAGVRRIEALTGENVRRYYENLEKEINAACELLKATPATLKEHIKSLQKEMKELKSENEALKSKEAKNALGNVMDNVTDVNGVKFLAAHVSGVDMNELRNLGDDLKAKLGEGVVLLISDKDGKVSVVSMATDAAIKAGAHAGNLIKLVAPVLGGGGGGRPNMAQAGGKDASKIDEAIKKAGEAIKEQIK